MKKTIIILHGWGLSGSKYSGLQKILEQKKYSVYSPDMPGFGKEPLKNFAMTIDDYVEFVTDFMKKKKIKSANFIGHSFGGRVTAKLAITHPELIEKIVFTGSPLIREKLSTKKKIVQGFVNTSKIFINLLPQSVADICRKIVYRFIGEWDYYKAKDKKATFLNVISENASAYISNIKVPVILIWGELDTVVSLATAKKIIKKIKGARLVLIKNAGHAVPYIHTEEFAKKVLSFIN